MQELEAKIKVDEIKKYIGSPIQLVTKELLIGSVEGFLLYMNGLVDKSLIDRDILKPLMIYAGNEIKNIKDIEYLAKKYIPLSNTKVSSDMNEVVQSIKRGKTIIILQGFSKFIIADTTQYEHRSVTESINEFSTKGSREGFIENLEVNISIMKRRIKDKNLTTDYFYIGRRSQTDIAVMYIRDIANQKLVNKISDKIKSIDVDYIPASAVVEQLIEKHSYSIFPQSFSTERPDVVESNLMEGKVAVFVEGTSFVVTLPSTFIEFFQTVEDYYHRTTVASVARGLRMLAAFIVISFPAVYVTLIKFNTELIPLQFIKAIVEARRGIALTPFMSILGMNLTIEFLREGGLRLPSKIGQTLSVVGGIIIGDAAIRAKIVSPTTLLVVGITTAATFVIPNYEMALSMRLLSYVILVLGNWLGMYGIVIGWFFILAYLCSLDSYGVSYLSFYKSDMKDIFIRAPLWKMNKRPEVIPNEDSIRQSDFKLKGEKNE